MDNKRPTIKRCFKEFAEVLHENTEQVKRERTSYVMGCVTNGEDLMISSQGNADDIVSMLTAMLCKTLKELPKDVRLDIMDMITERVMDE